MKKHTDPADVNLPVEIAKSKSFCELYWRKSLVPAPAVIPAPIRNIKVVAVKKLVVEILGFMFRPGN